jgi:hypothetical protein
MTRIEIIAPVRARLWHRRIVERLREDGHEVGVRTRPMPNDIGFLAGLVLAAEGPLLRHDRLSTRASLADAPIAAPVLRLDLTGAADATGVPTLTLVPPTPAMLATLAAGRLPNFTVKLDGVPVAAAAPMVDDRAILIRAVEDVLARMVTLTVAAATRWPDLHPIAAPPRIETATGFAPAYLSGVVPRVVHELGRRLCYRFAHWRVGYRLHDGPGIAETGRIGAGWAVLPDDGTHFYADPFPFEHEGRHHIFVEDYSHAEKKAVISVATLDAAGVASPPRPVLVEPHHLSYPNVFARDGEIWMLPQGNDGTLTLYRAVRFPERWERVATLIEREISDATILEQDGRLWLFATDRDGAGSTSDTLVVYSAETLLGPWTPHPLNPIAIDRRRARPGGRFIHAGGRVLLPIQDGTLGYGGGLGLAELRRLDAATVALGEPRPVATSGDFPYPQIHTLNRAGRLEVIDGIAPVRRWRLLPAGRSATSTSALPTHHASRGVDPCSTSAPPRTGTAFGASASRR